MIKPTIIRVFRDRIKNKEGLHSELRRSLLSHHRVNSFVDNLAEQFYKVDKLRERQGKSLVRLKTIEDTVKDLADVFISSVEMEVTKREESEIAKLARQKSMDDLNEMDRASDGKTEGTVFEDMGIKVLKDGDSKEESNKEKDH